MNIQGIDNIYNIDVSECIWNMLIMRESNISELEPGDIQNTSAIYIFFDVNDNPIRIGKAVKVRNRILSYATCRTNNYIWKYMYKDISYVSVIYTNGEKENRVIELDLLHKYKPFYNYHDID